MIQNTSTPMTFATPRAVIRCASWRGAAVVRFGMAWFVSLAAQVAWAKGPRSLMGHVCAYAMASTGAA